MCNHHRLGLDRPSGIHQSGIRGGRRGGGEKARSLGTERGSPPLPSHPIEASRTHPRPRSKSPNHQHVRAVVWSCSRLRLLDGRLRPGTRTRNRTGVSEWVGGRKGCLLAWACPVGCGRIVRWKRIGATSKKKVPITACLGEVAGGRGGRFPGRRGSRAGYRHGVFWGQRLGCWMHAGMGCGMGRGG